MKGRESRRSEREEKLEREIQRLQEENERLKQKIEQLEKQLEEALRAAKGQAAPQLRRIELKFSEWLTRTGLKAP